MDKGNHRSVSVLTITFKAYERTMQFSCQKALTYRYNIFSPYLAAFRSSYGCHSTLLKDWKRALVCHQTCCCYPWLCKMRRVNILIRLCKCVVANLRWASCRKVPFLTLWLLCQSFGKKKKKKKEEVCDDLRHIA